METEIFYQFRDLIKKESGISLGNDKVTLLENRIRKRLKALNLQNSKDYLSLLTHNDNGAELFSLLDAISTNLTFFFREQPHFDFLQKQFSAWKSSGAKVVKGWCAAASSGEEPYSIAMTAADIFDLNKTKFKLLATDICRDVLQKCLDGCYTQEQVQLVPDSYRRKYLAPTLVANEQCFKVNQEIAQLILFKRLNLASFPYPIKGPLDFISCRNVMIYFEDDLRLQLLKEFYRILRPGGILIVGHSESLSNIRHTFEPIQSAVYRKPGGS